jgi:hypothetical protein
VRARPLFPRSRGVCPCARSEEWRSHRLRADARRHGGGHPHPFRMAHKVSRRPGSRARHDSTLPSHVPGIVSNHHHDSTMTSPHRFLPGPATRPRRASAQGAVRRGSRPLKIRDRHRWWKVWLGVGFRSASHRESVPTNLQFLRGGVAYGRRCRFTRRGGCGMFHSPFLKTGAGASPARVPRAALPPRCGIVLPPVFFRVFRERRPPECSITSSTAGAIAEHACPSKTWAEANRGPSRRAHAPRRPVFRLLTAARGGSILLGATHCRRWRATTTDGHGVASDNSFLSQIGRRGWHTAHEEATAAPNLPEFRCACI